MRSGRLSSSHCSCAHARHYGANNRARQLRVQRAASSVVSKVCLGQPGLEPGLQTRVAVVESHHSQAHRGLPGGLERALRASRDPGRRRWNPSNAAPISRSPSCRACPAERLCTARYTKHTPAWTQSELETQVDPPEQLRSLKHLSRGTHALQD